MSDKPNTFLGTTYIKVHSLVLTALSINIEITHRNYPIC